MHFRREYAYAKRQSSRYLGQPPTRQRKCVVAIWEGALTAEINKKGCRPCFETCQQRPVQARPAQDTRAMIWINAWLLTGPDALFGA
jgi:hypothetical protein